MLQSRSAATFCRTSAVESLIGGMSTSPKSGRIWLADGQVHYESQDYGSWSFPVADLRVFGEYTTDHGPMIDDWFMTFVTSSALGWYEASVYADGADEFRKQLASVLGVDSLCGDLFASTEFASRITWPQSLRGQQLFRFTPIPMPWWRRVLRFGMDELRIELSPEARLYAGHAA
jgi:hypothetical protein